MKFFEKKKFKDLEFVKNAALNSMLAPFVDGKPSENHIISHSFNSHTLKPKFLADPPAYGEAYCGLDKFHTIDYAGMFESRGPELDAALYLGIQKILLTAKSARILVMVSA
jgi:hypothetical protein